MSFCGKHAQMYILQLLIVYNNIYIHYRDKKEDEKEEKVFLLSELNNTLSLHFEELNTL